MSNYQWITTLFGSLEICHATRARKLFDFAEVKTACGRTVHVFELTKQGRKYGPRACKQCARKVGQR